VAHQLADLGIRRVANLFTWDQRQACAELRPGMADAVFVKVDETVAPPPPPRLGIAMETHVAGVRIVQVVGGGVAEQAGVKQGDVLVMAAGRAIKDMGEVRSLIQRQAPGTWLPLKVRRDGQDVELVARFPPD
jgi:S1-C subfamily serine protease